MAQLFRKIISKILINRHFNNLYLDTTLQTLVYLFILLLSWKNKEKKMLQITPVNRKYSIK